MMTKYKIGAIALAAVMVTAFLGSCSDEAEPQAEGTEAAGTSEADAISFEGSVVTSKVITRADASLLDKNVIHLTASATNDKYVGIFGAYTGPYAWSDLKTLNEKDYAHREDLPSTFSTIKALTDEAEYDAAKKMILDEYYLANFFFNQKATVAAEADSKNLLSYEPIRFWPNNKIDATDYEYCTFWAYYPWNATGDPGENGIAIVPNAVDPDEGDYKYGLPNGMGKIKFTMQREAANQVDFLMSDLKVNCNKNGYPLTSASGPALRVPFIFHHMLAQVRIYAFIRCTDRIVYAKSGDTELTVKSIAAGTSVTLSNDAVILTTTASYVDAWGKTRTLVVGDKVPDDTEWLTAPYKTNTTIRWKRTGTTDVGDNKYFADKTMSVELMNIYTSAIFTPTYSASKTTFASAVQGSASGTSIVSDYQFRHDWFLPHSSDKREMLDMDHMYGNDGSSNPYFDHRNIMMVVPQSFTGDDVPDVRITVKGKNAANISEDISARVTYNMRNLGISWESGYIYSYAFIEELMPGDDKVKGPETIIVMFNPANHTDQW